MPWRLMSSSTSYPQCWCSCLRCSMLPIKKPMRLLSTLCGQFFTFVKVKLHLLFGRWSQCSRWTLPLQCDHTHRVQMSRGRTGTLPALFCQGTPLTWHTHTHCCRSSQHIKVTHTYTHVPSCPQYVFVTNNPASGNSATTHEVLATAVTAILKQTADFNTSNKLLKVPTSPSL